MPNFENRPTHDDKGNIYHTTSNVSIMLDDLYNCRYAFTTDDLLILAGLQSNFILTIRLTDKQFELLVHYWTTYATN